MGKESEAICYSNVLKTTDKCMLGYTFMYFCNINFKTLSVDRSLTRHESQRVKFKPHNLHQFRNNAEIQTKRSIGLRHKVTRELQRNHMVKPSHLNGNS